MSSSTPPIDEPAMVDGLSEQPLLRIVTENARVGLVVVSPERRYVYANATYAEILDLPTSDLVGQRLQDVLAGVYHDQVSPNLDRAFAGERVSYELLRPSTKGDRHYAVRYEPTNAGQAGAVVVVVITDITEQKQKELDASRFAAIVESSDDAIISKDLDGKVLSWNKAAERIFGYSSAEMVGSSILRIIPPERESEGRDILQQVRQGLVVRLADTLRCSKAGKIINVSVTTSPIRDATGKVIGASKLARDVTEQRRAEEVLSFQRAMLVTERELALDGVLVVDDNATVVSCNERFAQMWGVTDAILHHRADAVLLDAVRDKLRDPDRFMQGVRWLYEHPEEASQDEVELADGRIFDRYSAPMRNADGRHYGRVWYFRDVTERCLAEAALRRERDRSQRYLDTAEVLLLALDVEGRVTSINRKGCDLLGWSEEELLGCEFIEKCLPARVRPEARDVLRELLAGNLSVNAIPILAKGGGERLLEWRNRLLRDDDGVVVGTFSSGADVTEQRQAQAALRTAEERMRVALEFAGVGIWDADYASGVAGMSDILEAHYGRNPGSFDGTFRGFLQGVHPEDRAAVRETFANARRTGAEFSHTFRALWPDGTVRWLSNAGRIQLDEHGAPARGLGISLDVTDRHSLEEQYHQAQKMEAVGRLAGGVAHDFNNLLTAILGYCQLLLGSLDPHDSRRSDILEIRKAGESAASLTRQLLAFSRKQIIAPTRLDLNVVITRMQQMLRRLIGEDVAIILELGTEPMTVVADSGQMEQVVVNLAVNARDAMAKGGTLRIATALVELDANHGNTHFPVAPGRYVALTVSDTGTGMPPDVLRRLFEPFFTTKEPGKGTGLGLATVHGIVIRGGGSVGVQSELGRGTSFTVYLPRVEDREAGSEAPSSPSQVHPGGETVLVVEDARELRDLVKRMLELHGYTVLLAADATEAMEIFDGHPSIDLVLTDVVMPGCSGPELARQLLVRRPGLRILYMSGYNEDAITHHGVLDPGVALLHKPFTMESLGRLVRDVLDRAPSPHTVTDSRP